MTQEKLSSGELVLQAFIWAEESIGEMIRGTEDSDPHRAYLLSLRKQMKAYRQRRFGKLKDPLDGARLVSVYERPSDLA